MKSLVRRFRREEEGSMVVEAVIMFPTLLAAVLATFVFFDAFRNQAINLKAAYTVSDALSRETEFITNTYMVNLWRMHRFLTNSSTLTELRVTLIQYDGINDEHNVIWSQDKGGAGTLTDADLAVMVANDEVPIMPHLETLIMVQTWVDYEPNFSIGLETFEFENTIFTRPRFAPNGICYSTNGSFSGSHCPISS